MDPDPWIGACSESGGSMRAMASKSPSKAVPSSHQAGPPAHSKWEDPRSDPTGLSPEADKEDKEVEEVEEVEEKNEEAEEDLTDEQYFAQLDAQELAAYQVQGPSPESVGQRVLSCTACFKQVTNGPKDPVQRHPCLGVTVCRACKAFYHEGEWAQDEDGSDLYCRWCANGGDLSLCDHCDAAFCKRCIQRNLGRKYLAQMREEREWQCFRCQPQPIFKLRAEYYAASQWLALMKAKRKAKNQKKKESQVSLNPSATKKSRMIQEQAQAILVQPKNFIDQTLKNAFLASDTLNKTLDEERKRWVKSKKSMKLDNVRSTIKNLRRSFHATQYNMGALDRMLLSDYHEAHPEKEFTSVRIGKITSQSNLIPEPLKGKTLVGAVKMGPTAVNVKTTEKRKKNSPARQNGTFKKSDSQLPDSAENASPSKTKKAKRAPSPVTATSSSIRTKPGEYKVSLSLFATKKKKKKNRSSGKRESDDEIDIDINQ